jgi:hypothetical protein
MSFKNENWVEHKGKYYAISANHIGIHLVGVFMPAVMGKGTRFYIVGGVKKSQAPELVRNRLKDYKPRGTR